MRGATPSSVPRAATGVSAAGAVELHAASRLRRLAIAVVSIAPDGPWLAAGISAVLAGEERSLDEALGLTAHGGVSLPRQVRIARRNAMLRDFAEGFLSDLGAEKRAGELAKELARFNDRLWPRLSPRADCPPHLVGTRDGALFDLFKIGARPIGQKQLARLII